MVPSLPCLYKKVSCWILRSTQVLFPLKARKEILDSVICLLEQITVGVGFVIYVIRGLNLLLSVEDDDYEGYDYSLCGRLSAVHIVFLYRFVQEITTYFMELATPHTEEAIKLVDKVGDFEWLIQKYEIDGAAALKLDLSLDTPMIIIPRNSTSKDFIQLDLGQLQVTNEFSWHGSPKKDPSAVHIDVLHAEEHYCGLWGSTCL
ncbi:uncharacterized protein LOC132167446 isoform X2 [Corylus avellana]|uniref:uncharacterized protein LOC132167446 isoform X2 n=1 Tax=Corylus avellana TaxID=13451 RepID=UPI00286D5799|nr:uncharacterized protein LOC132167446 isoform X2 [Corylus avellana]